MRKNEPQPRKTSKHREIKGLTFLVLYVMEKIPCAEVVRVVRRGCAFWVVRRVVRTGCASGLCAGVVRIHFLV